MPRSRFSTERTNSPARPWGTLRIELTEPQPWLLQTLAMPCAAPVPPAVSGRGAEADRLLQELDAQLVQVRDEAATRRPVRVAYVLGGTPPWVAGAGTYVHEVLEVAGGVNVFQDLGRLYASVSPEEFVAREIDVILTPVAASLPAGLPHGARVVEVGDLLELPGPDVGEVAYRVARILAGGDGP